MSDDWERHRVFLAVLREKSLSGAARRLALAQPTVRRRIADLEAGLGVALFTRAPDGLVPTEAALGLRQHAEAMEIAAAAFARGATQGSEVAGLVRVSASEVISVEVLPTILADLRRRHPRLVVALGPNNRNEDLLRSGWCGPNRVRWSRAESATSMSGCTFAPNCSSGGRRPRRSRR
jgi:DNA-binding transcriptional LysR family regulator